MTDNKSSESRRKLLKKMAIGGATIAAGRSLPSEWSKPVVDSVLLPAHAQTSAPQSLSVTCTRTDPTATTLPQDYGQVLITGNVNPIPDTPYTVDYYLTCNGVHHSTSPQSILWPANTDIGVVGAGSPTYTFGAPINGLCPIGGTYSSGFTYQGVTGDCSWTITSPTG